MRITVLLCAASVSTFAFGSDWVSHEVFASGRKLLIELPKSWTPGSLEESDVSMSKASGLEGMPFAGAFYSSDRLSCLMVHYLSQSSFAPSTNSHDVISPVQFAAELFTTFRQNSPKTREVDKASLSGIESQWANIDAAKAAAGSPTRIVRPLVLLSDLGESKSHFSKMGLVFVTAGTGERVDSWLMLVSMTWVLVGDRLVSIRLFTPFRNSASYDELRILTEESAVRMVLRNVDLGQAAGDKLSPEKQATESNKLELLHATGNIDREAPIYKGSELDELPVVTLKVAPKYPPVFLGDGPPIGQATIRFIVEGNGMVHDAVVLSSSHREFEAPALAAINQWKFQPGRKNGRAVRTQLDVPLVFHR